MHLKFICFISLSAASTVPFWYALWVSPTINSNNICNRIHNPIIFAICIDSVSFFPFHDQQVCWLHTLFFRSYLQMQWHFSMGNHLLSRTCVFWTIHSRAHHHSKRFIALHVEKKAKHTFLLLVCICVCVCVYNWSSCYCLWHATTDLKSINFHSPK